MTADTRTPDPSSVHLPSLVAFEVVARHLNFARAADEMKLTPTAVSQTIKRLESSLGMRLFNRTTRSVALTEGGSDLLASLAPALAQIRSSVERVSADAGKPSGRLRINTSGVAYTALIEPHLGAFTARFPEIVLDVQIDDGLADIVAGGFDAGIRLGHALQRDMVAVPVGPLQQLIVVGSPQYLDRRGTPKAPKDLLDHDCIRQRLGAHGRWLDWAFSRAAKSSVIEVQGGLVFNEMRAVLGAARGGCGLAYVFRQLAAPDLREGRLVALLERYTQAGDAFHLYYPSRALMPGKLRVFIDFLRAAN